MTQLYQALLPLALRYVEQKDAERIEHAIERRISLTVMQPASDERKEQDASY